MRRREFIGLVGGGLAASPLASWPVMAQAQQTAAGAAAIKPAQAIADFIINFDLKNAPQIVIDRSRTALHRSHRGDARRRSASPDRPDLAT